MKMENWRPVVGFEDVYEVSDLGRIKRVRGAPGTWAGRLLKPVSQAIGYTKVTLRDDGRERQVLVHIVVAEAFIRPRGEADEVNHRNGVKDDNRLANLEYVTRQENIDHSINVLGHSNAGSNHGLSKFSEQQILEIRARRATGEKLFSIAASFNCSFQHVSYIANRKCWTHI